MVDLNSENFQEEVMKCEDLVVIDCWAPWCGPCKMFGPIFEEAAGKIEKDVKFVKLNTDEYLEGATYYSIQSIPTVLFVRAGVEVKRLIGVQSVEDIEKVCVMLTDE